MCQKNDATVHFNQAVNGQSSEMHLCESCARSSGIDGQSPLPLSDILFGVEVHREVPAPKDLSCPVCHLRRSDFAKTSRLGCPACYETFREDLEPLLRDAHTGARHIGKAPETHRLAVGLTSARQDMDRAISRQDYEEAAKLRDSIREMEKVQGNTVRQPGSKPSAR